MKSNIDNIFERLVRDEKALAICGSMDIDWPGVTVNLNNTTLRFFKERNLLNKILGKQPGGPMTQLIGFNLKELRNKSLLHDYVKYVHDTQMIYINRWGDLPVWGEVFKYILPKHLDVDKSISYYHGSVNQTIH